ncbi:hypothetical protein C6341_g15104 [Phytophthora cactorum]|nr:hypothetical protein C6341_g15104 [Phytophthora cactorum]
MELIANLRNAVLQQREQEVTNFFTNVNELREFISAREPAAGVNITVKMCCYNCERLSADTVAHYDGQLECLCDVRGVTVWDSKTKVGSPKTGRMHFHVGAVYEFKQVHSVGYFSDIAKGSVQLEDGASDRVVEGLAPVLKRKAGLEPSGRHPKTRALLQHDEREEQKERWCGDSWNHGCSLETGSCSVAWVSRADNNNAATKSEKVLEQERGVRMLG